MGEHRKENSPCLKLGKLLAKPPSGAVDGLAAGRAGQVLLGPTFQHILPSAACAESDFIWESLFPCKETRGQCCFKAASAQWGVFDTPALGPRRALGKSGGNFLHLEINSNSYKELAALEMLLSLNLRNVLGSATGVPGWCKVCALGSRIPLLLAILGIYSMSGLSEFVEVHISFFFSFQK